MTFDLLALPHLMKGLRSLSPSCLFHISRDMKGKSFSVFVYMFVHVHITWRCKCAPFGLDLYWADAERD